MSFYNKKQGSGIRVQIYSFIVRYLKEHGYPPSVREIGLTIIKNSSDILLTRQLMGEPKERPDSEPQRIA